MEVPALIRNDERYNLPELQWKIIQRRPSIDHTCTDEYNQDQPVQRKAPSCLHPEYYAIAQPYFHAYRKAQCQRKINHLPKPAFDRTSQSLHWQDLHSNACPLCANEPFPMTLQSELLLPVLRHFAGRGNGYRFFQIQW